MRPPRHLDELSIWRIMLGTLDSTSPPPTHYFPSPISALWKDAMMHWSKLILISNQGLALCRQNDTLRFNRHKNLQKQSNDNFFIHILYAYLHFTSSNFPISASIEEIRNSWLTHTFKPTYQTLALIIHISIAFHPGIFQTNLL